MIKTFYKSKPPKKIFFTEDMKIRSYAYGHDVWEEFIEWRKNFLVKWNSPKTNYLLLENVAIDANPAKIDKVGELRIEQPRNQTMVKRNPNGLSPLWLDKMYLEADSEGELIINGQRTQKYLGTELKAWGISVVWTGNTPLYALFVFGKNKAGVTELRAHPIEVNNTVFTDKVICAVPHESTLGKKSRLYCFGKHIFFINDGKLSYYYFNTSLNRLEEVAINTDEPNEEKAFCNKVDGNVVCDANGYVHWRSENKVYSFPIGYPRRLCCIDMGERNEIVRIQTFKDSLFIYRKSRITKEYSCFRYRKGNGKEYEGEEFNRGAKQNLLYAEKNGLLHYVKIPALSKSAYIAKSNAGVETLISQIDISGAERMFCVNGDLYLGCSYIGSATKN